MNQPVLDIWRPERSAANVEKALRDKFVPALQRAVIEMLMLHPRSKTVDGMRQLQISLRQASEWIVANVTTVAGMKCDHSGVSKALQAWIDHGVMSAVDSRSGRVLWLSIERLRNWHDQQTDHDEPPLFSAPQSVASVDSLSTGVDRCRPLSTGVDSQKSDRVIEEEFLSQQKTNPQSSLPQSSARRESTAVDAGQQRSPVQEMVRSLPSLPEAVWSPTLSTDRLRDSLRGWCGEHCLRERCGELWDDVRNMVVGLILIARSKNKPRNYYASCLEGHVKDYVSLDGKAWILKNMVPPKG